MIFSIVEHNPQLLTVPSYSLLEDGRQEWRLRDRLHRLDGPAVLHADGAQEWLVEGYHHRLDGPALIRADGSEEWFVQGFHHRSDGPAIIYASGTQHWFVDGKRHRLDGPAIIRADGAEEWWVDDCNITHLSAHTKLVHIRAYLMGKPPPLTSKDTWSPRFSYVQSFPSDPVPC